MPRKPTFRQRMQYLRDRSMSRGTPALIGGLLVASAIIIVLTAGFVTLTNTAPDGQTFPKLLWDSLMRTLDPGTMGSDAGKPLFLGAMLFVTLGGIFIVSALIGVLSSELDQQLERLRKGRSLVLENNHTVILGWSPQIFTILSELMIANENQKRARIVVLAEKDKAEMEDEIRERVESRGSTRVICRNGSPIDLTDLEIVSPHTARAIIVLPPENDDPDSYAIKAILAITNNPHRHPEPYHIVTQIRDAKNLDVIHMIGEKDIVQPILTSDLIARVMAQTSRQSGLSVVYTELLNFEGDEIYLQEEPTLVGKTYGEALTAYETSSVMGLRKADGSIMINPPLDTPIETGDKVFAITEDDDTLTISGLDKIPIDEGLIRTNGRLRQPTPEKTLILGWNRCSSTIIRELDNYVAKGSQVLVIADADAEQEIKQCAGDLVNQEVTFRHGDTTDRHRLDELHAADYNHIIVLSYDGMPIQEADAKTLVTLLHLRDIAEHDQTPFSIVSEMLDLRNRQLAEVAHVDDFIVSDHLVSLMMAQLSENADLHAVFEDIFDPEGSEIYLKPISDYVELGQPVNFYTLVEAARRRGETAIGYRLDVEADNADKSYGVHANPDKSNPVTFSEGDKLIVLAEN
ncbi:MAG: potassium transporter TrkA [Chloroflexi bacterium]|nr:potassium transporter TrkA [Chloroflexota bacterium]